MESLAESMREQPAMPRFEDESVNLGELMRRLAEDVVNAIIDAEADQLCAGGANSRNGYRERNLVTCVGEHDDRGDCSLAVSFENGETLSANARLNEIAKAADVQVIRSGLYANMTNRRVGPRALRNCSSS